MVILGVCLSETRWEKLHDRRFQKAPFSKCQHENEKCAAFSNSSGLKGVSEKLRFRDGL